MKIFKKSNLKKNLAVVHYLNLMPDSYRSKGLMPFLKIYTITQKALFKSDLIIYN